MTSWQHKQKLILKKLILRDVYKGLLIFYISIIPIYIYILFLCAIKFPKTTADIVYLQYTGSLIPDPCSLFVEVSLSRILSLMMSRWQLARWSLVPLCECVCEGGESAWVLGKTRTALYRCSPFTGQRERHIVGFCGICRLITGKKTNSFAV